jgi:hypothetical protein
MHQSAYAGIALHILGGDERGNLPERFRLLANPEAQEKHKRGTFRIGILAELGRLAKLLKGCANGDEITRQVADLAVQLLEDEWTAKAIEMHLRERRLKWRDSLRRR